MAEVLMRSWATSIFSIPLLGILLFCSLIPSISLADVSLTERRPVIAIPAAEVVLEVSSDMKTNHLAVHSMLVQSVRQACFSIEDQQEVQSHDDNSTRLAPLTMVCVSLIADFRGNWLVRIRGQGGSREVQWELVGSEGSLCQSG